MIGDLNSPSDSEEPTCFGAFCLSRRRRDRDRLEAAFGVRVSSLFADSAADCVFIGCDDGDVFSKRGSAGGFSFVAGRVVVD